MTSKTPTFKEAIAELGPRQLLLMLTLGSAPLIFAVGIFFLFGRMNDEYKWQHWPHVVAVSTSSQYVVLSKGSYTRTTFSYERSQDGKKIECIAEAFSGGRYSYKRGLPGKENLRFEIAIDPAICGTFSFEPEPPPRTPALTAAVIVLTFVMIGAGAVVFLLT